MPVMAPDEIIWKVFRHSIKLPIKIKLLTVFQRERDLSFIAGKGDYFFHGDFIGPGLILQSEGLFRAFSKLLQRLLQYAFDLPFFIWF